MTSRLTYKPKASPHEIVRYVRAHYESQGQSEPIRPKTVKTTSANDEKEQKEGESKDYLPEPRVETR